MALTRKQKEKLLVKYEDNIQKAKNIIVMKQFAIPVNEINKVRIQLENLGAKIQVVKKRIFLNNINKKYSLDIKLNELEGSVLVLYSYADEYLPLKSINNIINSWKKEKTTYNLDYLGGIFDNKWQTANYVLDLAILPSKEELLSKFLYLLNSPISGFVRVIQAIKEQKEQNNPSN